MPPIEEDVTLLASNGSYHDPAIAKKLPRLSPWARFESWTKRCFRKCTQAWWTWELAAAMVSSIATIALIIVLVQADQHRQLSWAIVGTELTLNTVVAAIGTMIRTSLYIVVAGALNQNAWNWFAASNTIEKSRSYGRPMKDLEIFGDAAANSWSCLRLLWRTRCCYLISIGAIVMILSIGFDSFLQQVLSAEQRTFFDKQDSTTLSKDNVIPRSHAGKFPDEVGNFTSDFNFRDLMSSWILHGESSNPSVNCPTGDCVWPVTPSMGIYGECTEITPTIDHSSNDTCPNITTISLPNSCSPYNIILADCGPSNSTSWRFDYIHPGCANLENAIPYLAYGWYNMSSLAKTYRAYVASLYLLGTDDEILTDPPPLAYRCTLSYYLQGFQASTVTGRTEQNSIDVKAFDFWLDEYGTEWYGKFTNIPSELNVKEYDQFKLSREAIEHLQNYLYKYLTGSGRYTNTGYGGHLSGSSQDDLATLFWEESSSLDNITHMVENLANGLTSYLRTTSDLQSDPYYAPDVGTQLPVVIVRWPWLSYPLFLQALGITFLLLTMRATKRCHVLAWKGHRTALLLATMDDSLRNRARGGLASRTGLDDRVGDTLARLDFDGEDGIVFRRADHPSYKEAGHTISNSEPPPASNC